MLHQGSGELQTVTGADLRASHHEAREDPYRLAVGLIGAEAMLRLFPEQEANERAFTALTRFLDTLDAAPSLTPARPALDPLALSFQLKLLWLSGYMPHLDSCVECGLAEELVGYLPSAGGAVCRDCGPGTISLSPEGLRGIRTLLQTPLADAYEAGLTPRAAREALAVVTASYEHHGGFRLRTLSA
jgi:DNA repair protein RecO (recombination protein O)